MVRDQRGGRYSLQRHSIIKSSCNLVDISPFHSVQPTNFSLVSMATFQKAVDSLLPKNAVGPNAIPNEILKKAFSKLVTFITPSFNAWIHKGYFPVAWRTATTAMIQKADKPDYSAHNACRTIALLCTLGKQFEKILNEKLFHWMENKPILPPGHMSGQQERIKNDALSLFASWVKSQGCKGKKVVAGLFLDAKLAYPLVFQERLVDRLRDLPHICFNWLIPFLPGSWPIFSLVTSPCTCLKSLGDSGFSSPSLSLYDSQQLHHQQSGIVIGSKNLNRSCRWCGTFGGCWYAGECCPPRRSCLFARLGFQVWSNL